MTGLEKPVAERVCLWVGAVLLIIASKISPSFDLDILSCLKMRLV